VLPATLGIFVAFGWCSWSSTFLPTARTALSSSVPPSAPWYPVHAARATCPSPCSDSLGYRHLPPDHLHARLAPRLSASLPRLLARPRKCSSPRRSGHVHTEEKPVSPGFLLCALKITVSICVALDPDIHALHNPHVSCRRNRTFLPMRPRGLSRLVVTGSLAGRVGGGCRWCR